LPAVELAKKQGITA